MIGATPAWEQVLEFMIAFDQPVRDNPTADIPDQERVLRAKLVLEEALEFVEAMGCTVQWKDYVIPPSEVSCRTAQGGKVDLVAAADALADITYVTEGSGLALGLPTDTIFAEVHRSNMAKIGGGLDEHGKKMKPEGWTAPDIAGVLRKAGWDG